MISNYLFLVQGSLEKIRQTGSEGGQPSQAGVPAGDVPAEPGHELDRRPPSKLAWASPAFPFIGHKVTGEAGDLVVSFHAVPASVVPLSLKKSLFYYLT